MNAGGIERTKENGAGKQKNSRIGLVGVFIVVDDNIAAKNGDRSGSGTASFGRKHPNDNDITNNDDDDDGTTAIGKLCTICEL